MRRDLVLYPFLIECCQYTDDKYWKSIFEDLAYGIAPYGTYINKDLLTCNYKDKEFVYKIQKKNSKEIFEEIFYVFKSKLNLMSRDEIIKKRDDIEKDTNNNNNLLEDWMTIKKKNLKEVMIERYVLDVKKRFSLSIKQAKYLLSIIFLAFTFKIFNPIDVQVKNGKIETIQGLEFEQCKIILKKNIYNIQVNVSPEIFLNTKLMSDEWEKFILALKKL